MGSVGGDMMGTDDDGPEMLSPNDDGKAELSAGERSKSSVGSDIVGVISDGMSESGAKEGDFACEGRSGGGVGGLGVGIVDSIDAGRCGLGAACCYGFSRSMKRVAGVDIPSQC